MYQLNFIETALRLTKKVFIKSKLFLGLFAWHVYRRIFQVSDGTARNPIFLFLIC